MLDQPGGAVRYAVVPEGVLVSVQPLGVAVGAGVGAAVAGVGDGVGYGVGDGVGDGVVPLLQIFHRALALGELDVKVLK